MAKPVDMARTAAEKKADEKRMDPASSESQPDYPWGLRVNLDDAGLKKLGITELPKPGDDFRVDGTMKVLNVRKSADEKNAERGIELQITHLALESTADPRGKATAAMYPSAKKDG